MRIDEQIYESPLTHTPLNLVIFGTASIAIEAHHYFLREGKYRITAFVLDEEYRHADTCLGLPVISPAEMRAKHSPENTLAFVGISYGLLNQNRASVYFRLKEWGYRFANIIDPSASVFTREIGEHVFIRASASVGAGVTIGNDVMIGPNVVIGHDSIIRDHSFISPGVCLCGENEIGEYSVVGAGAIIGQRVRIGNSNLIGAGARIFSNTGENEAYLSQATVRADIPADRALMILEEYRKSSSADD